MGALRTIVIGVDFSPASNAAVRQACTLARQEGARVYAVHVLESRVVHELKDHLGDDCAEVRNRLIKDAEQCAREVLPERDESLDVSFEVEIGDPACILIRFVQDHDADLLVLGRSGTSTAKGPLGSVAAACVRALPTSLLLVDAEAPDAFTRVVAGVNLSPADEVVAGTAARVVAPTGGELYLLHVFQGPWNRLHFHAPTLEGDAGYQREYRDELERRVTASCGTLLLPGECIRSIAFDCPSATVGINKFANLIHADLLVLGGHDTHSFWRLFQWSTAERAARECPCALLIVRVSVPAVSLAPRLKSLSAGTVSGGAA